MKINFLAGILIATSVFSCSETPELCSLNPEVEGGTVCEDILGTDEGITDGSFEDASDVSGDSPDSGSDTGADATEEVGDAGFGEVGEVFDDTDGSGEGPDVVEDFCTGDDYLYCEDFEEAEVGETPCNDGFCSVTDDGKIAFTINPLRVGEFEIHLESVATDTIRVSFDVWSSVDSSKILTLESVEVKMAGVNENIVFTIDDVDTAFPIEDRERDSEEIFLGPVNVSVVFNKSSEWCFVYVNGTESSFSCNFSETEIKEVAILVRTSTMNGRGALLDNIKIDYI